MSIRQHNLGSIVKPGFNALGPQTSTTTYFPYLYSWGSNAKGQLGLNNLTTYSSPKQVGTLTTWAIISVANEMSAAIKNDGTLWTWGTNTYGQLGLNTAGASYYKSSPTQVGALTNWKIVDAGSNTVLATKIDGTLWAWGRNNQGQLGLGTSGAYTEKSSPVQVGALTNWATVCQAGLFSASIKTDGTLWTWGFGPMGQLGLNNLTSYSSPKQVGVLTNWKQITAASNALLSVKTDGTLWSWGAPYSGQTGLGVNAVYYSSPKQVGALTTWKQVDGGLNGAKAIKIDNTLWVWGDGTSGALGLGNLTSYSSPKQLGSLTNWSTVSYGNWFSLATKTDGTLWSWGDNALGKLGLGNTTYYSSPKQVGALTTWLTVSCGTNSSLALLY